MSTTYDDADDGEKCQACEDSSTEDMHACEFVNLDCPNECSIDHGELDREFVSECPQDDSRWCYCDRCGWESVSRRYWVNDPQYVNGELLCDPSEHGYDGCCECGEWVDQDDVVYDEEYGDSYCERCAPSHTGSDGEAVTYCARCGTYARNLHGESEEFLCDCEAIAAHLRGEVVEFDHATFGDTLSILLRKMVVAPYFVKVAA